MGFVNTGNTNTLELNLTDYGKKYIGGSLGTSFLQALVNAKFALRDEGIDYRRFSSAPVQGAVTTTTNGPCYDQQYEVNPYMERLSGTCFFNYPDVRGRGTGGLCLKSISQTTDIDLSMSDNGWNDNVLHIDVPGIQPDPNTNPPTPPPIPDDDDEIIIPPPPPPPEPPVPTPPACFDMGYDSTVFGLNESGCACLTYVNAWESFIGASQNVGSFDIDVEIEGYDPSLGFSFGPAFMAVDGFLLGYAYYYPSAESVVNMVANMILSNNISNAVSPGFWGPIDGVGMGTQLNQVQTTATGGLVGDVYGDGNLGCDDLAWGLACYCQGINEGDVIAYPSNTGTNFYFDAMGPLIDSYILAAGCTNMMSAKCDGSTPQCSHPAICGNL
jgi:hypothetical protein